MEWINNSNKKCRFFLNNSTNHYTLVIGGFYYESKRFKTYDLLEDDELNQFNTINESNMYEHIDFLKELSNKVLPFKSLMKKNNKQQIAA